jgi:plasmid stability protein
MGQVLIRNLADEVIAAYREAAARNQRSLEAELRETIARFRPRSPAEVNDIKARLAEIRAMTPAGVNQTPSEALVREMRDTDGFRDE